MIGRFLLGAGLGGLVGTGLLAMASLLAPAPAALHGTAPAPAADPAPGVTPGAPAEAVPEAPEPPPAPPPEPTGETRPEPGGNDPAPAEPAPAEPAPAEPAPAEPAPPEPAAVEAPPVEAPPVDAPPVETQPVETAPSLPAPAAAPTPGASPDSAAAPAAPAVPPAAVAEAPPAPQPPPVAEAAPADLAERPTPVLPVPPVALAVPGPEAPPALPEVPAAAPDLAAVAPPAALAVPALAGAGTEAPLQDTAPAAPAGPADLALAAPEAAPPGIEPPGPPPLTPEEQALLAEIAANGPGTALPPPETAPAPAADPAPEAAPEAAPGAPPAPPPEAPPEAVPAPPPAAEAAPEAAPEAVPVPEIILPEGAIEAPEGAGKRIVVGEGSTLPPVPALGDKDTDAAPGEGIVSDRLPRIGDAGAAADAAVDDRPITRNARAFDNAAGKPVFAVILIDGGDAALDRAALADLPFPVTFALDPLAPAAAERAEIYRAAGQEVVMLATGLPKGASASDVEVAFQSMLRALPQAVAVLDLPGRAFQGDRVAAGLVVPVIGAEGLGLVTWDAGLNAADQVARREDVPAAVAFRALDAEGESATVIRRYLDRAAFKAAQEGHVTVIGTTRPETVAALLEWTVEGRAATVALAPVTAVLSVD